MSNEELVTLQEAIDGAIEAENEHLDEIKSELEELNEYEEQHGTNTFLQFGRRWYELRISNLEQRLAWLRREFHASTMGKVE